MLLQDLLLLQYVVLLLRDFTDWLPIYLLCFSLLSTVIIVAIFYLAFIAPVHTCSWLSQMWELNRLFACFSWVAIYKKKSFLFNGKHRCSKFCSWSVEKQSWVVFFENISGCCHCPCKFKTINILSSVYSSLM